MKYNLLIINEPIDKDIFLVEFNDGGDEYDDETGFFRITVGKDCKTSTINKIFEIIRDDNTRMNEVPLSLVISTKPLFIEKDEAIKIIKEYNPELIKEI